MPRERSRAFSGEGLDQCGEARAHDATGLQHLGEELALHLRAVARGSVLELDHVEGRLPGLVPVLAVRKTDPAPVAADRLVEPVLGAGGLTDDIEQQDAADGRRELSRLDEPAEPVARGDHVTDVGRRQRAGTVRRLDEGPFLGELADPDARGVLARELEHPAHADDDDGLRTRLGHQDALLGEAAREERGESSGCRRTRGPRAGPSGGAARRRRWS